MNISIKQIIEHLENSEFPDKVQLNESVIIVNPRRFYENHVEVLRRNPGNPTFKPYYDRLLIFYNQVKQWQES